MWIKMSFIVQVPATVCVCVCVCVCVDLQVVLSVSGVIWNIVVDMAYRENVMPE
jgi:hypothetical protein